jgi:type II secretory pathway pseudopilin PulG
MKTFISIFAVTLALAFPVFAGDTAKQAQEQCQKDGGNWDAKTKTCSGKY